MHKRLCKESLHFTFQPFRPGIDALAGLGGCFDDGDSRIQGADTSIQRLHVKVGHVQVIDLVHQEHIADREHEGVLQRLVLAFGAGLVLNQGGLDNAWEWIRGLPLILQGVAWLLFLPVVGALWAWETSWPLVLRLVIVAGLCGWSLMIFLPRSAQG